jgi:hypothetical protein
VWESAARLAEQYGTNRIARALRLNHSTLKKRINGSAEEGEPKKAGPVFVELDVSQTASAVDCSAQLESRGGVTLRIEVKGGSVLDLLPLAKAFWSQGG